MLALQLGLGLLELRTSQRMAVDQGSPVDRDQDAVDVSGRGRREEQGEAR